VRRVKGRPPGKSGGLGGVGVESRRDDVGATHGREAPFFSW
jgi:hypothetical protein